MHSSDKVARRHAEQVIAQAMDQAGSCSFLSHQLETKNKAEVARAFPHTCIERQSRKCKRPESVADQNLRNLRHKGSLTECTGMFAFCPHCTKSWTNSEFVASYLVNHAQVPGLSNFPDGPPRRLKAMAVEYQQKGPACDFSIGAVVEGAYNLHGHTFPSCFGMKTDLSGKKRKAASQDVECRYRFPQRKKRKSCVQDASDIPVRWFLWDGSHQERHIKEVCPK